MATFTTACPLDCPDTCSLAVTVEDGRLTSVDAAPGNPLTAGYICHKVKHHARRVYAPERILTPLVRTGPKGEARFREASWEEAIELVATRVRDALRDDGPASVLPYLYSSSAAVLASQALTPLLFARLGVPEVAHTICAATAGQAWDDTFGDMLSADPLDRPVQPARRACGAPTRRCPTPTSCRSSPRPRRTAPGWSSIDPRRTGVAHRADLHLPVRPGTDVVLAYALARLLEERGAVAERFCADHASGVEEYLAAAREWPVARAADVCGLAASEIEELADAGRHRPAGHAAHRLGPRAQPQRRLVVPGHPRAVGAWPATSASRARGVIASLGGGSTLCTERVPLEPVPDAAATVEHEPCRRHPLRRGARAPPPARVLFVQGANPAATAPDQPTMLRGLSREDVFTVVHEQVMTDTARYADVVLPATTHFEADDVADSYGSFVVQPVPAVIDRVGESRTNDEVAVRAGRPPRPRPARSSIPTRTGCWPASRPVRSVDGVQVLRQPGETVQFVDTFPSLPDRRARLHVPDGELPAPALPAAGQPPTR